VLVDCDVRRLLMLLAKNPSRLLSVVRAVTLLLASSLVASLLAVELSGGPLLDLSATGIEHRLVANDLSQVAVTRAVDGSGVLVTITPGANRYPGVAISPDGGGMWRMTKADRITAVIANEGKYKVRICMRVDNLGDWTASPWNTEKTDIDPGDTGTLVVRFGYSWGQKGYALDPTRISQVLIYVANPKEEHAVCLRSIVADGEPPDGVAVP
jgi:hypothetical protein